MGALGRWIQTKGGIVGRSRLFETKGGIVLRFGLDGRNKVETMEGIVWHSGWGGGKGGIDGCMLQAGRDERRPCRTLRAEET